MLPGNRRPMPIHHQRQPDPLPDDFRDTSLPKLERSGSVFSDLHLLARRSTFEAHLPQIEAAIDRSKLVVLNGDIFDFRWATMSMRESIDAACAILRALMDRNPACEIHYVLGNHDRHPAFQAALEELRAERPQLEVYPLYAKIGSNLFLHGDLPEPDDLCGSHTTPTGNFRKLLYDVANALGAQKLAYLSSGSPEDLSARMLSYLERVAPEALVGVDNIYFGHTHVHFENHLHRGILFHNTGAAIKHMELRILGFG